MPEIRLAKTAGFCFGVRNAVEIAEKTAREAQKTIYTYGPLIHNQAVVAHLEEMGIHAVETLDDLSVGDTVIIRAHGVGRAIYQEMEARGIKVIDGTCPRVQMIHRIVEEQETDGKTILIFGDPKHPEVRGIAGWRVSSRISRQLAATRIPRRNDATEFNITLLLIGLYFINFISACFISS